MKVQRIPVSLSMAIIDALPEMGIRWSARKGRSLKCRSSGIVGHVAVGLMF